MPSAIDAKPEIDLWLYKTISRDSIDGKTAVSTRYEIKDEYVDLTPFLNYGSSVRASKSVRQPAGGFSITFADKAQKSENSGQFDSLYDLIEPMDLIEIRMWGGVGPRPVLLPIVMRGFVSEVSRSRIAGQDGRPQRTVTVSGQDYGKIWQTYQVLHLAGYTAGKPLLTTYKLFEMIGADVSNTMSAADFVSTMIDKVINPYMDNFMPDTGDLMPRQITVGDGVSVKHGMVNTSSNELNNSEGTVYSLLMKYGDVGIWNELYTEDREDGVHLVYRPIPAYLLDNSKIQNDAPDPPTGTIRDFHIKSIRESRSDANVANFFWLNGEKFDLLTDITRKLYAIKDGSAYFTDYPNASPAYYGLRPMYAVSQQGGDEITNMGTCLKKEADEQRANDQANWLTERRRIMTEMNLDNVVYETGVANVKGGPTRDGKGGDLLKAGDYVTFVNGQIESRAYAYQVDHEFAPFHGYTTTIMFDRGEGFFKRAASEGSPWLLEQAGGVGK